MPSCPPKSAFDNRRPAKRMMPTDFSCLQCSTVKPDNWVTVLTVPLTRTGLVRGEKGEQEMQRADVSRILGQC